MIGRKSLHDWVPDLPHPVFLPPPPPPEEVRDDPRWENLKTIMLTTIDHINYLLDQKRQLTNEILRLQTDVIQLKSCGITGITEEMQKSFDERFEVTKARLEEHLTDLVKRKAEEYFLPF